MSQAEGFRTLEKACFLGWSDSNLSMVWLVTF
jgi:hypothetical protein